MQFSSIISIQIMIFVLGLCGFFVAKYIRNHKIKNAPLVCPMRFDCHAVVHSDYSRFLGAPVEIFGMAYYVFISFAYLFLILTPEVIPAGLVYLLIAVSAAAFLFSVYLIAVQIFILKKGCSWCIVSALISALIFFLAIFTSNISFLAQSFLQ